MTSQVDLHIHTSASEDGELSPREVLTLARERGLHAVAFSDHDSTAAVEEGRALAGEYAMTFLPAVELTTLHRGKDVHVLGYFVDPANVALLAACEATRSSRVDQARSRIDRMRALGFEIDFDRVMEIAAGRPPTSAILMAAFRDSYAAHPDRRLRPYIDGARSDSPALNLFLDFFTPGKPCYVEAETLASREAVPLILGAGGVPVLAHPGRLPVEIVEDLVSAGFGGIEVLEFEPHAGGRGVLRALRGLARPRRHRRQRLPRPLAQDRCPRLAPRRRRHHGRGAARAAAGWALGRASGAPSKRKRRDCPQTWMPAGEM